MNNRHLHRHAFQAFHVISVYFVITGRKYVPAGASKKWTAVFAGYCRFLPFFAGLGRSKLNAL